MAALGIYQGDVGALSGWLHYYGEQLGRENCYILSIGDDPELSDLAQGCSIMRLPQDSTQTLKKKRGRIVNNLVVALLCYHAQVVFTGMDERVLVDPATGKSLRDFLAGAARGQVLTPLGLEQVSGPGQGLYVRPVPELSRPCVLSTPAPLSRDATLSRYDRLHMPEELFLLKVAPGGTPALPDPSLPGNPAVTDGFDLSGVRQQMQDSWAKMENSRYWHFQAADHAQTYLLPERFSALL